MDYKNQIVIGKLDLSQTEMAGFYNTLKSGVYKELYIKQMLTGQQLNELLAQLNKITKEQQA